MGLTKMLIITVIRYNREFLLYNLTFGSQNKAIIALYKRESVIAVIVTTGFDYVCKQLYHS
jgi:hypothetical protein